MGNANNKTGSGKDKLNQNVCQGSLLLFHQTHSPTVRLSLDRRLAKRFDGIKGICFSDRPVQLGDLITFRILETSNSRNGALRFGLTCEDPKIIEPADLLQYASPDLTCEQGYWAKAVPERLVQQGNVLGFWLSPDGDVFYGCNGNRLGVFFRGVQSDVPMWAMLDVFGSTIAVTLIDEELPIVTSEELSALSSACPKTPLPCPSSSGPQPSRSLSMQPKSSRRMSKDLPSRSAASSSGQSHGRQLESCRSMRETRSAGSTPAITSNALGSRSVQSRSEDVNVLSHQRCQPQNTGALRNHETMPFHYAIGRNICLSSDRTIATRLSEDYCNGYVFTSRPLRPGEKFTIEVTGIDLDYVGGLAFGMTACDPAEIRVSELPDDSDQLLDRPEYWVVHKDVYVTPEVGDRLTFYLTRRGEARFDRNGFPVATLMHVDISLELWAFIDVYGTTQRIRSCGVTGKALPSRSTQRSTNADAHCQFAKSLGKLNLTSPQHQRQTAVATSDTVSNGCNHILTARMPKPASGLVASPLYKGTLSGTQVLSQKISDPFLDVPGSLPPPLIPVPAFPKGGMTQSLNLNNKQSVPSPDCSFSHSDLSSSRAMSGYALDNHGVASSDVVGNCNPLSGCGSSSSRLNQLAGTNRGVASTDVVGNSNPLSGCGLISPRLNQLAGTNVDAFTSDGFGNRNSNKELQRVRNEKSQRPNTTNDPHAGKSDSLGNECAVCLEKPPDCALYTCGHMCMCYECAVSVLKSHGAICPICRKPVLDVIKIFKS